MEAKPRMINRTIRTKETEAQEFRFTAQMIPYQGSDEHLQGYRRGAWEQFTRLPLPTPKDEAWRRTDIHALQMGSFTMPTEQAYLDLEPVPQRLLKPVAGAAHGGQIVLMPGRTDIHLDPALTRQGVIYIDYMNAENHYPQLLASLLGQIVKPEEGKFAALAAALSQTGVFLYVPKGVRIEQPLHSLLWGPGIHLAYLSHLLIWLEDDASVTYVHEAASSSETAGQTLHSGLVEIHVGKGADLKFVELQSWGEHVWNFSHERVKVEQDGNLEWIFGAVGSHLTKNFSDLDLVGRGSTGRMSGFYFTDGEQHFDHDTQQNHLAPNTTSDLLFKGALEGKSRSVWQGMIYVAPGAFKTDGYQANRNLVLNAQSRADSIPGLEILADDVRCTHGATVGKIDEEQIFYLNSRGIDPKEAGRIIVEGFFDPIMQRIPFEGVRERFQAAIHNKMESV